MKRATPAEQQAALDALCPLEETPKLTVLDRSTLEAWATCPFQAAAVHRDKRVNVENTLLVAGQEGHDALSRATLEYVRSGGVEMSPRELSDTLALELQNSRPDVQPEVIDGVKRSIYAWGQFLGRISPLNILAFDGGEEVGKSGQLSLDFPAAGVRVTSEIDLLHSGPSIDLLHECDYKTGHKVHTAADVADSFQFGLHAVLVFAAYPAVRAVEVVVWNTRTNNRTFRVIFERDREPELRARVAGAIQSWWTWNGVRTPECWPTFEHCSMCDAAAFCPVADQPTRDCATDPVGALNQYLAADARAEALKKLLVARVDAAGIDIVAGNVAFGRAAPAEKRKPARVYKIGASDE